MQVAQLPLLEKAFAPVEITSQIQETLCESWQDKSFKKGEFITEAGRIEKYFYFVLEGVQALYLIDSKGDKVILGFSFAGNFSGVFDSFLKAEPSDFFLEALLPSKMLTISLDRYHQLFERYPEFNVWGKNFMENILIGRIKREVEILTMTAEERYTQFMRRCPDSLKEIPQKYLASYLNMKPETFSRLRASVDY